MCQLCPLRAVLELPLMGETFSHQVQAPALGHRRSSELAQMLHSRPPRPPGCIWNTLRNLLQKSFLVPRRLSMLGRPRRIRTHGGSKMVLRLCRRRGQETPASRSSHKACRRRRRSSQQVEVVTLGVGTTLESTLRSSGKHTQAGFNRSVHLRDGGSDASWRLWESNGWKSY